MKYLMLVLMMISPISFAGSYYFNVGLFTEHYIEDSPEYNEDNEVLQITFRGDNGLTLMATKFRTSHFKPAKAFGIGGHIIYKEAIIEIVPSAVHGYEGDLDTHYKDWIFGPLISIQYQGVKAIILGPVINLGYEFKFL